MFRHVTSAAEKSDGRRGVFHHFQMGAGRPCERGRDHFASYVHDADDADETSDGHRHI